MANQAIHPQHGDDQQHPAADLLIAALKASDPEKRFEAARALRDLHPSEAVPALIQALGDENPGVRWLAGEALIRTGAPAVPALLHELAVGRGNVWIYEEAAHVLRHLQLPEFQGRLSPVIAALAHPTARVEAPVQAELALTTISPLTRSGE